MVTLSSRCKPCMARSSAPGGDTYVTVPPTLSLVREHRNGVATETPPSSNGAGNSSLTTFGTVIADRASTLMSDTRNMMCTDSDLPLAAALSVMGRCT